MRARGTALALLAPVAAVLAVATIWLALDNPDIDGTSRGDNYTCLAPWDTVLNDADNFPGGEPPPDGEEIAVRCRAAGNHRFGAAVASGAVAIALVIVKASLARHRSRTDASSPA